MTSIKDKIATWGESLSMLEGTDRLEYLLDLAKETTTLDPEKRLDENKVHGCVSTLSLIQSCFKGLLSLNILVLFDETKCTMIVPFPGNLMCPVFMCFLNDILLSR